MLKISNFIGVLISPMIFALNIISSFMPEIFNIDVVLQVNALLIVFLFYVIFRDIKTNT